MAKEGELMLLHSDQHFFPYHSTVILWLKTLSIQWPSVCRVNYSDETGCHGGGSAAKKNFSPRDVPPVVLMGHKVLSQQCEQCSQHVVNSYVPS